MDLSASERVLAALWLLSVSQKLLIFWEFHSLPSLGFTEHGPRKRKYPMRQKMHWREGSGDNGRTGARWQKVRSYLNNQWLQAKNGEQLLRMLSYSSRRPTSGHSCLLTTAKWGCKSYLHHEWAANKSAATAWCYPAHTGRNLWGILPTPGWKDGTKNGDSTGGKRGSSLFTSQLYRIILKLHLWSGGIVVLS